MIRLQTVEKKDRDLFWNINQKYLYEMTNFYDDPMDENGNFHYGHFDEYFTDPKRKASNTTSLQLIHGLQMSMSSIRFTHLIQLLFQNGLLS